MLEWLCESAGLGTVDGQVERAEKAIGRDFVVSRGTRGDDVFGPALGGFAATTRSLRFKLGIVKAASSASIYV
jgi:hypothetical protein